MEIVWTGFVVNFSNPQDFPKIIVLKANLMSYKIIIGIMGPGEKATRNDMENAYQLGKAIATEGWITLTGGRDCGVMEAASRGASEGGGTTVGILPTQESSGVSKYVDIPIFTGMSSARNNINVLSCRAVVGIGIGPGTASELALAIKARKPVILCQPNSSTLDFFKEMSPELVFPVTELTQVVGLIRELLKD